MKPQSNQSNDDSLDNSSTNAAYCEIDEDSWKLSEGADVVDSSSSSKRKLLHLRSDVVNKTLLRSIRKFYINKFKKVNRSIVRKRFKNVKTTNILRALIKFWMEEFSGTRYEIDYKSLAEFMMVFLSIKPSSTFKFRKEAVDKATQVQECIGKYSLDKFKNVKKIKEFRILIVKIYNCSLDELLSSVKTIKNNKDRYTQAIEDLLD